MEENIFEVKVKHISDMPEQASEEITRQISEKVNPDEYMKKWKGFCKVIYVTASPQKIDSISPIDGNPVEYFKAFEKEMKATCNIF